MGESGARSASGRLIEHDALDERVAHGVARPARPRRLIVADDEHLGGNAERAQDFLKPDDLAAAAEAVVLDDEEVEVALRVGLAASVRAEEDDTRRRAGRLAEPLRRFTDQRVGDPLHAYECTARLGGGESGGRATALCAQPRSSSRLIRLRFARCR